MSNYTEFFSWQTELIRAVRLPGGTGNALHQAPSSQPQMPLSRYPAPLSPKNVRRYSAHKKGRGTTDALSPDDVDSALRLFQVVHFARQLGNLGTQRLDVALGRNIHSVQ